MRIAIDARELCGKATGVGRYLFALLVEWGRGAELARHEWTLYAHEPPTVPPAFRDRTRLIAGAGGTRWEQWDLARRLSADRPDVLFAPGYTAPLTTPCPVVLTIHDVSFFDHPEQFRWREALRRRQITAWAARRARVVLTVSEFSRARIAHHIGLPLSRIRVIYHGIPPAPERGAGEREPLVLYVGSIFPRRHVDVLVTTFGRLVAPQVPEARLEVIGENRLPPHVSNDWLRDIPADARRRISMRSWVDEATLTDLYRRASVFAFLSDYEGFGLTPLEALSAGIPPVVLDTPVAREIYGSAARFLSSASMEHAGAPPTEALAEALVDLLTSEAARHDVLQHAPEVLARYHWDHAARLTLDAIEEAGGA